MSPSRTDEPGGARIGPEAAQALGSRMLFDGERSRVSGKKVWMPGARKKEAVCCITKAKGWWIALVRTEGGRGERGVGQPGRGRIEEEEEEGGLIWTYDGGSREGGGAR